MSCDRSDLIAQNIVFLAPLLDHCKIDTSIGQVAGPVDQQQQNNLIGNGAVEGQTYRDRVLQHGAFLRQNKRFRTFATPSVVLACRWPGPKKMDATLCEWATAAEQCPHPHFGVLISEKLNGKRYEIQLTLTEFFSIQNMRNIRTMYSNRHLNL